ncbi:polysaccharide deacetylase family protein [Halobacillus salinarum]|uniref:Polysaccharide deacetylase family protein n=1 Tax=Halobacillus salinarum TaxID=2932257 RepID=A0ABY4EEC3_9BACI|nr:polysaccharide deacetylase family protein [Halobacillus salinarum]UOQ42818.1 polysaccharide deacetylase family protein [Halobacillus salinarum]
MRSIRIIVLILMGILFLSTGTYYLMNARTVQLFGGITSKVSTEEKVVALTFDDGPTQLTDSLLQLLNNYKAKATFFLIGNELEKHMDFGRQIAGEGHQLGNHSYTHKRMIFKSQCFIKKEIERTNDLIRKTGYEGEIDFRPPNGKKLAGLPYYLNKQGIETITWSLEPDSYFDKNPDKLNYVKEKVEPGSIILLHPMYDKNELEVVQGILESLSKEGYQFVTVNELQQYESRASKES